MPGGAATDAEDPPRAFQKHDLTTNVIFKSVRDAGKIAREAVRSAKGGARFRWVNLPEGRVFSCLNPAEGGRKAP